MKLMAGIVKTKSALLLGLLCLVVYATPAVATTRTVNSTADPGDGVCDSLGTGDGCTLREAIATSQTGGTIKFSPNLYGTINLKSGLSISKALSIIGPGASRITVSRETPYTPTFRILTITGGTVAVSGLSITNGSVVGAKATNNSGPGGKAEGGGIFIGPYAQVTLRNLELHDNAVYGGDGGADAIGYANANGGAGNGGGIANYGTLTMTDCYVYSNQAVAGGAVATNQRGGHGHGGGVFNGGDGFLNIQNCTIAYNTVRGGGAYQNSRENGDGKGGGICNNDYDTTDDDGIVMMTNCTVSGNWARGGTGYAAYYGDSVGGGVMVTVGRTVTAGVRANITNCTITANMSHAIGGFEGTEGRATGGGLVADSGTVNLLNTLIADNNQIGRPDSYVSPDVLSDYGNGAIKSLGHNLVSRIDGSPTAIWTDTDSIGTVATPTDARLASSPTSNGGPTPTCAILPDSPARNAGDDAVGVATDQRGYPRKIGTHVDIGAFEFDPPQTGSALVVNTKQVHDDGVCGIADCTLWDAVNVANDSPDSNTITFKSTVRGSIIYKPLGSVAVVTSPITIKGPGARLLALDGNNINRLFYITGGPVVISGLTIRNGAFKGLNEVIGSAAPQEALGGGVYNTSDLTLSDCTLQGNTAIGGGGFFSAGATARGGGIYSGSTGILMLRNCTLQGNAANGGSAAFNSATGGGAFGGGIYNDGVLTVTNCTFSGNTAQGGGGGDGQNGNQPGTGGKAGGGGICNTKTLTITNCTLTKNAATGGFGGLGDDFNYGDPGSGTGGGLFLASDPATVRNTIIAGNNASTIDADLSGSLAANDHNLIGGNTKLGALANNGGPTDTCALQSDSPAINAGDPGAPVADQRHYTRQGVPDIGAFEFNGLPPHRVSGRAFKWVLSNGVLVKKGLADVVVELRQNGTTLVTRLTDENGNYSFASVVNGSYTVRPSKSGVVFDPLSRVVSVGTADVSSVNFKTYSISVTVVNGAGTPLSGIKLKLSGAVTLSVTTGSDGKAVFNNLGAGTYTVTPQAQSGFVFTPATKSVTLPTSGVSNTSPNGKAKFTRTPASAASDKPLPSETSF